MADLPISSLPISGGALDADEFAVNQGGTTVKLTRAQVLAGVTTDLSTHISTTPIDHPALSVDTGSIANLAVTEGKIGPLAVTEGKIGALAVTEGKIGNSAVTAAKIADRTRHKWCVPSMRYDVTNAVVTAHMIRNDGTFQPRGSICMAGADTYVYGSFVVPADFYSGLVVNAVFDPGSYVLGNQIYAGVQCTYAALGEAYNHNSDTLAMGLVNPGGVVYYSRNLAISSGPPVAGDMVTIWFQRDATVVTGMDTLADDIFFVGWRLTYTADS